MRPCSSSVEVRGGWGRGKEEGGRERGEEEGEERGEEGKRRERGKEEGEGGRREAYIVYWKSTAGIRR